MNRRRFLQHAALLSGSALLGGCLSDGHAGQAEAPSKQPIARGPGSKLQAGGWRMPDEAAPHAATWMAFGAQAGIWGKRLLEPARRNLADIARAIAQFEPVRMLVPSDDLALARRLCGDGMQLIAQPLDDIWMRDSGPVFVHDAQGQLAGAGFNFNGWGKKQEYGWDRAAATAVCERAGVSLLKSRLVLEGGALEVDGDGAAIITESCVLNPNRNPGVSKAACEAELQRLLGVAKVIWLPGIAGRDITDGHTDFYARFIRPGVVIASVDSDPSSFDYAVQQRHLAILRQATDAKGRRLQVVTLRGPDQVRPDYDSKSFAAGYVNFYVCNGAVIAPQFGDDDADGNCRDILREQFPEREIVQLNIDAIAGGGGGGIHCVTQQQPA
ncbi:agmatine/peptidylarginine deiminase [Chromobacterium sp. IIBBL 290-4]|uniref:agmatine deiminase family protein n=1 Tax=Chromobacterium sp. IIBBL 290-4 TaxID=2953890 RepID=UPI0020B7E71F|nr:agmatine deiminase family protein [Chromobacterium sp. IIBBL 290-4]UTH74647.1 agmatine deiminase family protein [Chromobacterium sp. IIBBL 290-4]